jgi:hypothetical protein
MKIFFNQLSVLFCYFFLTGTVFANYDSDSIRQSILALDKTRINIVKELEMNNKSFLLTAKEKREYGIFIEYIEVQINHYCMKLYQINELENVKDLPCKMRSAYFINKIPTELKTTEEEIASFEDLLISSLGDFDEMLLKEEETLNKQSAGKNHRDNKSEFEKYIEIDGKNQSTKNNGTDKLSKEHNEKNHNMASTDYKTSDNSGKSGNISVTEAQHRRKSRKLEKVDDDIVARQLREAAVKEIDPELKKKLWEEYEKYKQKKR